MMNKAQAYHRQQDPNRLVERYAGLVKRIGQHMLARLPSSVQLDDLLQAGMIGLLDAYRNYDAGKGASFETYAGIRIRGAMIDEIRQGDWVPRSVHRNTRRISDAIHDVEKEHGRDARDTEVAAKLDIGLAEYHSMLNDTACGRIVGIDVGSGLMRLTSKAMRDYGITQLQLVPGSGASMAASLTDAIFKQEWIVVTAWSPHWMFSRWPMHYLDDPQNSLGKEESIFKVGRVGLEKDHPEVWAFLSKFRFEDASQLQRLMDWNQQRGTDPVQNASRFMKENPRLVESWLKK